MRPGVDPLHALAEVLLPLIEPELSGVALVEKRTELAEKLKSAKTPLWDLVAEALRHQKGTDRLLLVVDQWEELYTQCEDSVTRQRFIEELLAATARKQSPLSVVLTVRSDFYTHLLQNRALLDQLQDGRLDLGPMTRNELREAIAKPAANVGLTFQDGLVDRLLDDGGDEPGNLPLLEFALQELWKRRNASQMTHAAYEALGRLSGAIATRAEEVYRNLDPAEQAAAPLLFRRLVRAGTKTEEDTRRRADLRSLDEATQRVVRRLADERLLVTTHAATSDETSTETVEVAHEELLRRWGRLKQWVDTDRKFLQWRGRLAPSLEQFQRDPNSALLRYGALSEARQFYPARKAELEDAERAFVSDSIKAERRRKLMLYGSLGMAVFVVCGIAVGIGLWRDIPTVDAAIISLPETPPKNVPGFLKDLAKQPQYASRQLQEAYRANDDDQARLRLAYGLIAVGAVPKVDDEVATFVLGRLADAPEDDNANLVDALARLSELCGREQVLEELLRRASQASAKEQRTRTRYSLAALSLREMKAADQLRISDGDPTGRTRFIQNFPAWPIDLTHLCQSLRQMTDPDIRSGLCTALGGIDLAWRSAAERQLLRDEMWHWYQKAPDSGTHSAAGWALRQWKLTPPKLKPSAPQVADERPLKDHPWYVNSLEMKMVGIPADVYRIG